MIEYEGETNVTFLADQITTTDEGLYANGGGVGNSFGKIVQDLTTLNAIAKKYSLSFDRKFKYYTGNAYNNIKGETLPNYFTHNGRVFELKYFDGSFSPFLVELNPKNLVYRKDTKEPAFKNYPNPKWDKNKYYTYANGGGVVNEWVVNFASGSDYKTKYVKASSESEAIDKGFRLISEDGEDSDEYSVESVYKTYANGGGVEDYDYYGSMTDESVVMQNCSNGEIHCDILEEIIGSKPEYPYQEVGSIRLQKCYLRPYYKICK
jgi:hypothetical protein